MPSSSKTLNAWVKRKRTGSATVNAWVIAGRHRHHRTRDHFGADSDLFVTLDQPIGPWGAGTPIKFVIDDLYGRITNLTSYNHQIRVMHLNAYVLAPSTTSGGRGVKTLNAVVKSHRSSSFVLRALVVRGGAMHIDAWVRGANRISVNAWVV